jgi:hypothetical protein
LCGINNRRKNNMRPVLTVDPSACIYGAATPAHAGTLQHSKPRQAIVRLDEGLTLGPAASAWAYAPARPPIHFNDTPSYDDPSKFGGGSALPVDP